MQGRRDVLPQGKYTGLRVYRQRSDCVDGVSAG